MEAFLAKIALALAACSAGAFLRTSGVFSKQDAKAATLALVYGTYPSIVLQTLLTFGTLGWVGPAVALSAFVISAASAGVLWKAFSKKSRGERALLTGTVASVALGSVAYAFVDAVFGPLGLHLAVLWDTGNLFTVLLVSPLVLAANGRPVPERYVHADGGIYRGQWRGGKKDGLGVYSYPGGGRYEGRWRDNLKDGLGIYYYPKGGWYGGEWRGGERSGLGMRIFKNGNMQAAQWQGTEVLERRDAADCMFTATSAREAAMAARGVPVGGNSLREIALQLLAQPVVWAVTLAVASIVTNYQIPVALDFLTAHLASAHIPLALLIFGLSTDFDFPRGRQASDLINSLAVKALLPLAAAAVTVLALPGRYVEAIGIAALCAMGPMSEQTAYFVQLYKLDAVLHGHLLSLSRVASLACLGCLAFAMVLATPLQSTLGRTELVIALLVAMSTSIVLASVASWWLSSRKAASAAPVFRNSQASTPAKPQPVADIPIGIAWKEQNGPVEDNPAEEALEASQSVPGEEGEAAVALGEVDTGEGAQIGEASVVSGWGTGGNVLVGAQVENCGNAAEGELIDMQQADDFDLGGERPDLDSAQPEAAAESSSGGRRRARQRRRRPGPNGGGSNGGSSGFQDVEENDFDEAFGWQEGVEWGFRKPPSLSNRSKRGQSSREALCTSWPGNSCSQRRPGMMQRPLYTPSLPMPLQRLH